LLKASPKKLPANEIPNIIGKVPIPKSVIYAVLCRKFPADSAAANERYTNPQGSNPFTEPIKNKVVLDFLPNNFLNTDLIFIEYFDIIAYIRMVPGRNNVIKAVTMIRSPDVIDNVF